MSALAVEQLSFHFGGLRALDNVALAVEPGERRVILGPNGAGKTTFFNLLTGLHLPSQGCIRLFGRDITRLATYRRAQLRLGRTFQITTLFPKLTVLESVLLAMRSRQALRRLRERADALLAQWGLGERSGARTHELSYGEQRQLELVLALAAEPRVLLLDEPTAGLSPAETTKVAAMIGRFSRDVTILLIEHDMDVALALAERVTVFHRGHVIAEGTPEEIRREPKVAEIYLGVDED
jgi:branched-chain amino acid transport system ATP-binding protein